MACSSSIVLYFSFHGHQHKLYSKTEVEVRFEMCSTEVIKKKSRINSWKCEILQRNFFRRKCEKEIDRAKISVRPIFFMCLSPSMWNFYIYQSIKLFIMYNSEHSFSLSYSIYSWLEIPLVLCLILFQWLLYVLSCQLKIYTET